MRSEHGDSKAGVKSRSRGIAATAGVYIVGTFLAKGARLLLVPLYVHQLARVDVGILVFLEAVSIALSRALTLSLGQAVKRFYVDYTTERDADNFVAALWCIGFIFAIAMGPLLIAGTLLFGHHLTRQVPSELLTLAIVSAILRSNIGIVLERFIARGEPYQHGLFNIGHFLTTAILTIVAITVLKLGLKGALWADIVALATWNVVTAMVVLRRWPDFKWSELAAAIRYSLPAVPHSLFTWAITFVDRIILERFVPLSLLAIYGVGYQFASLLPIFSLALVNAWLPRFYRTAMANVGPRQYARVLTLQLTAIIGVGLCLIAFGPEVIRVLTTSAYSGAVPVLRVVAASLILHGTYQALLLPLFYRRQTSLISIATGTALLVNVGSNLLLIPRIGIMGAAIATLLAYGVTTAIVIGMVARQYPLPVDYRRLSLIVTLAAAAAAGALTADSPILVVALTTKLAWLALFYIPVLFVPGFVEPSGTPLVRRLRRRKLISTPSAT